MFEVPCARDAMPLLHVHSLRRGFGYMLAGHGQCFVLPHAAPTSGVFPCTKSDNQ